MRNYLSKANDYFGLDFFDRAFDDFFKPVFFGRESSAMRTDVKETDGGFELSIDMPGFDKKDIELTLNDGYLTVKAQREEKEENKDNYLRRERSVSCTRSYYVGDAVTEEDVKAKYENGTLNLLVPKKDKKQLPRKNISID